MATLTSQQLKDSYQSLVTIGDSITSDPTSGQLENGKGTPLTAISIGTSASPDYPLDVQGSGSSSANNVATGSVMALSTSGETQALYARFKINNAGISGGLYQTQIFNKGGTGLEIYSSSSLTLGSATTERMRLEDNGDISFRDGSANEAFYWDASTARLGLGTTTPNSKLNVISNGVGTGIWVGPTNSNFGLEQWYDSANGVVYFDQKYNNNNGSIFFRTKTIGTPVNALTILGSGNVGIGTTSPDTKIHIDQTSQGNFTEAMRISNTGGGVNEGNYIQFEIANTNGYGSRIGGRREGSGGIGLHFYTGAVNSAPSERMRIDSSGNVGINAIPENSAGTWRNYQLGSLSMAGRASNVNAGAMFGTNFKFTTANAEQRVSADATSRIYFNDDVIIFQNAGSDTAGSAISWNERMRILSSGGITFNGDTSSANALDDYEEGTWTPVYASSSGSFTTMTMDTLSATYTKVGRQVTVRASFRTDNVDATGASGLLQVSGLPFASAGSDDGSSAVSVGYVLNWGTAPDSGLVIQGQSYIVLRKTNATAYSQVSDLTTGATADQNGIILTATYFV